ncbi:MAG: hemerythrin domain-containing protein [Burkholderiaceae bacterium]|nr:hemerythrin domain-containing protein [Burkholderiaceae bacterium]
MNQPRQVSRLLDEEHSASLELLGQLEQRVGRASSRALPSDPDLCALITRFIHYLAGDLARHFEFEEDELFPRLVESGDGDIVALLSDEHDAMRELSGELLPLAESAARGALDVPGWQALRRAVLEMVERQVAHIQKEAMALLPMLDDLLDDDTDQRLALAYAAG